MSMDPDSRFSSGPRYLKLQADLSAQISDGRIRPGASLPSEEDLCRAYGVSRTTVRKALDGLRERQLVESRRGAGTFVSRRPVRLHGSLVDLIAANGDSRNFLADRWIEAPPAVSEKLQLTNKDNVKYWEILLHDMGHPFVHVEYYLPRHLGERLESSDVLRARSVSRAVEEKTGKKISRAHQTIAPKLAGPVVATHLNLKRNAPILHIVRTYFDGDGVPILLAFVHAHPDRYQYAVELFAN